MISCAVKLFARFTQVFLEVFGRLADKVVPVIVFLMQEYLIRDDNKLILLASLSDSLEYVADSIERQVLSSFFFFFSFSGFM